MMISPTNLQKFNGANSFEKKFLEIFLNLLKIQDLVLINITH